MRRENLRRGSLVGQWKLVKRLGSGGNGDVWRAVHADGRAAAVKVLRDSRRDRRARFHDEIEFLLEHDPGPGVLPLIDASLPASSSALAWYAMPIATPLRDALGDDAPVEERVRAIRQIAGPLARLAERGVGHRDIKPDNLFEREGEYLIGDFGLVTYPEKDPVTRAGKRLGPIDYLAPEMRENADTADAERADVYALAKTLWVLLTGQSVPLPGTHRIDEPAYRLETYLAHPRLRELDLLLERSTRHIPTLRPTMAEVVDELDAWLDAPEGGELPSLADIAVRVDAISQPGLRSSAGRQRLRDQFDSAWESARAELAPLHDRLADVFPIVRWHHNPTIASDFGQQTPPTAIEDQRTAGVVATNADDGPVELRAAIAAQWVVDEEVRWACWLRIEDPYAGSRTLWTDAASAPLGSARQEREIQGLLRQAGARLRDAAVFTAGRMELRADATRYAGWTGADAGVGPVEGPWSVCSPFGDGETGCYVVDTGNDRILHFTSGGAPLPWMSGGGKGLDHGNLDFPTGACVTHEGKLWIADHGNARLRYFNRLGEPLEGFGLTPPGRDRLQGPADVASGPDGAVYIVDRLRNVVLKFTEYRQTFVQEWGGSGREPGRFAVPCGVAVRHGAFVYVSDSGNHRVQKFTADGELVTAWGALGSAHGAFQSPHGIALDADENVYVADSENHRIQQFTSHGEFVRAWGANGGDGSAGNAPGQFIQPRGVSVDGVGNVYVAEFGSGRIQRFAPRYLDAL